MRRPSNQIESLTYPLAWLVPFLFGIVRCLGDLSGLLGLVGLMMIGGCATAPPFHPSQPLAEAGSVQQKLLLCHEYQVPRGASRPIALKPFVDCLNHESEGERGQDLQTIPQAYPVFRSELNQFYSDLHEPVWDARQGADADRAIHLLLRALWRDETGNSSQSDSQGHSGHDSPGELRYVKRYSLTQGDRVHVMKYFPKTVRELGPALARAAEPVDPELEKLRVGVATLPRNSAARELLEKLNYLTAFRDDLEGILSQSPGLELESLRARYRKSLKTAQSALADLEAHARVQ